MSRAYFKKSRKVKYDGYTFDSKAEYRRYQDLKLLELAGTIKNLRVHPKYVLQRAFTHPTTGKILKIIYIADFHYLEKGRLVVEEVKGYRTALYKLKRKMFLNYYRNIDFREINKENNPQYF